MFAFLAYLFRLPDGAIWGNFAADIVLGALAWWRHRVHLSRQRDHIKQHVTEELERLFGRDN